MSPTFTIPTPRPLPVERHGQHWWFHWADRRVRLSNLDKAYWPEEGYTKGDLLAYYFSVAPLILPYLAERPLTLKRMPDGIVGPYFYEKNAPSHTPEWMPRCPVPSEDRAGGVIDFLVADDPASLLFVANLGCIEFHPLHSRCGDLERPDYLFFDLDPAAGASFEDVLAVAWHVHAALEALGLPGYPKTSGATGIQVFVPIRPGPTYRQVRELVARIGRAIRDADPQRVTMEHDIAKRSGRVFIDHNMNRSGANIASAYSVRPEPGAPVSTPLTWEEVEDATLRPGDFTMATIHERLERVGDLFAPVLEAPVELTGALERLGLPAEDLDATRLSAYEQKRRFDVTPEPSPAVAADAPGSRFVIHKHDARRLHYDLRLEREGVLVSWAVPRGLPTRTGDRRLAVRTEDHPLAYGEFEGHIPAGQYGAGEVRIFDRGTYEPLVWEEGRKITFRLRGERLHGEYHLVKTDRDWLILLSQRSTEGEAASPPDYRPMLAQTGTQPFDDPRWRFEPKLDGVRTLVYVTTGTVRLISRTGRDQTSHYPELARVESHVDALGAVLDGEIVAPDEHGRPSFERLQQRMNLTGTAEIARARGRIPVQLFVFDILWLDGTELTRTPLSERRAALERTVTEGGSVRLVHFEDAEGVAFFDALRSLGLEGMVAKRLESHYTPGRRSPEWLKIKAVRTQDCVIVGWTPGTGSRSRTFGALLLGAYRQGTLRWIGSVGTGFTAGVLEDVLRRLQALQTRDPPLDDADLRAVKGVRWVRPELVCEVEYLEVTDAGKLRAPSFKGLRPDKTPDDCELEPQLPEG